MRIAISKIQKEESVSDVKILAGAKVLGGGSLIGSTSSFTNFNNTNIAIGNANVFAITNTSARGDATSSSISGRVDGTGFSFSSSSSFSVAG